MITSSLDGPRLTAEKPPAKITEEMYKSYMLFLCSPFLAELRLHYTVIPIIIETIHYGGASKVKSSFNRM